MSANAELAFLLLPDLEAVAAAERTVAGMPLLLRTCCTLRDAGVMRVIVAAPAGRVPRLPRDDQRLTAARPAHGGASASGGAVAANATALVIRGDLVYQRDFLRGLVAAAAGTAVATTAGEEPRCVACVVPAAPAADFAGRAAATGLDATVARDLPRPAWLVPAAGAVLPVRCRAEVQRAERRLLQALRKPTDGVFSRCCNRRISLWVTSLLMDTPIHPNHVSVVTLLLGVLCGVACAMGGWAWGVAGALLLEAQSILDGVDGELARLKHLRSRVGEWLDTIADDLTCQSFLLGVTINLARSGADWAVALGSVTIGAALAGRVVVYWLLATVYHSGSQFAIEWDFDAAADVRGWRRLGAGVMTVLRALIKRDCFATLFVLLALLGRLDAILALAAVGAVGYLTKLVPQTQRVVAARRPARLAARRPSRVTAITVA